MANYLLYKHHVKDGPPTEVIGVAGAKNAKIRAYRIAMREKGNLDYIGIKTVTASHNMYSKYTAKVKYTDGKVWYTSGRKKREMLSNGDFVSDQNPRKGEDIFAWYKGERKPTPKTTPKPKEQPANLMSSKFMRDHIIVARPAPVKGQTKKGPSASALFTWDAFNRKFNYYYTEMYEGRLPETYEWVEKGDKILQTKKKFVNLFVNYRKDVISSDREAAALARAYEYFQKAKMLPPNL